MAESEHVFESDFERLHVELAKQATWLASAATDFGEAWTATHQWREDGDDGGDGTDPPPRAAGPWSRNVRFCDNRAFLNLILPIHFKTHAQWHRF